MRKAYLSRVRTVKALRTPGTAGKMRMMVATIIGRC